MRGRPKNPTGTIYIMSLCFNLPSEMEQRTKELYERNKGIKFKHYIIDLGFPLEYGSDIPDNVEQAKKNNTEYLLSICKEYGSEYLKFENIGVSQNYTQFMKAVQLKDEDILICADPDEIVHTDGWVIALAKVIRSSNNIAWCGLSMADQVPYMDTMDTVKKLTVKDIRVNEINGIISCAQWGISGAFLNKCGGMPVPNGWSVYGFAEGAMYEKMMEFGWWWGMLPDYIVEHSETSTIYREYKDAVTSGNYTAEKQINFETWLELKQKGNE